MGKEHKQKKLTYRPCGRKELGTPEELTGVQRDERGIAKRGGRGRCWPDGPGLWPHYEFGALRSLGAVKQSRCLVRAVFSSSSLWKLV